MNFYSAADVIRSHKFYFTVSICTISGALLYNYLRQRKNKYPGFDTRIIPHDRPHDEKLLIENEHIPKLVDAIKNIEQYTNTKIKIANNIQSTAQPSKYLQPKSHEKQLEHFRPKEGGTHRLCIISGLYSDVKEARYLLLKEIERLSIVREEICFSKDIYRKIYANECEVVQELNRITSAKVDTNFTVETDTRKIRIVVSGNKQQVDTARKLIEATVKEWENNILTEGNQSSGKAKIESCNPNCPALSLNPVQQTQQTHHFFEVNVSAIASPSKFWIQLCGPNWVQLEKFMASLSIFYESPSNRKLLQLVEPQLGQLVAAFFPRDDKWYRAEIIGLVPQNDEDPNDFCFDLYFVDYGNSEFLQPCYVFNLHERFKTMSYQAAECFLVNVHSSNPVKPDVWDEDATCFFEKLTDNIGGKRIICQVMTYKQRHYKLGSIKKQLAVAGIELFYAHEDLVLNIGQMMISNGFARPAQRQYSTIHDAEIMKNKEGHDKNEKNNKNMKNNQSFTMNAMKLFKTTKYLDHDDNKNIKASPPSITSTQSRTTSWQDEKIIAMEKNPIVAKKSVHKIPSKAC